MMLAEVMTLMGVLNSVLGVIGRFTDQATAIGELVKKLQSEDRAMTQAEWAVVNATLEEARTYAKTAQPPVAATMASDEEIGAVKPRDLR